MPLRRQDDDDDPREDLRLAQVVLAPDGLPTVVAPPREPYAALVPERLVCMGCRWYMDLLVPSGDVGPGEEDPQAVERWCLRHGDLRLTDAEVFACSRFEPAPWARGARALVKRNRRLIAAARRRIVQRTIVNARNRGEEA